MRGLIVAWISVRSCVEWSMIYTSREVDLDLEQSKRKQGYRASAI